MGWKMGTDDEDPERGRAAPGGSEGERTMRWKTG